VLNRKSKWTLKLNTLLIIFVKFIMIAGEITVFMGCVLKKCSLILIGYVDDVVDWICREITL